MPIEVVNQLASPMVTGSTNATADRETNVTHNANPSLRNDNLIAEYYTKSKTKGRGRFAAPLCSVIGLFEVGLANAAGGTHPVRRKVFKGHVVVLGGIVHPTADLAHILLVHNAPAFPLP